MDKIDMLTRLVEHFASGNKSKFASTLGIKANTLSNWFSRGMFDPELIKASYPEVSGDWLLTGEGAMMLSEREGLSDVDKAYYRGQIDILREALGLGKNLIQERVASSE